jgi:hypothetical protein
LIVKLYPGEVVAGRAGIAGAVTTSAAATIVAVTRAFFIPRILLLKKRLLAG